MRNTPAADPPWPVRRLLRGRKIEYLETRRRCARRSSLRAPQAPRTLAVSHALICRRVGAERKLPLETHFESVCTLSDRVRVSGTVTIDSPGPGRTRQRFRGTVSVGISGIGSLVEGIVLKRIHRSYEEMPAIVDDWLAHRSAAFKAQRRAEAQAFAPAAALAAAAAAGREVQRLCSVLALSAAAASEPLRLRLQPA